MSTNHRFSSKFFARLFAPARRMNSWMWVRSSTTLRWLFSSGCYRGSLLLELLLHQLHRFLRVQRWLDFESPKFVACKVFWLHACSLDCFKTGGFNYHGASMFWNHGATRKNLDSVFLIYFRQLGKPIKSQFRWLCIEQWTGLGSSFSIIKKVAISNFSPALNQIILAVRH